MSSEPAKAYAMNGGEGIHSYSKNSFFQRKIIESAGEFIEQAVARNLDINICSLERTFRIADFGCSVGPNTFHAVQKILEAVQRKYHSKGLHFQFPEFQVFYNDQAANDFNTLFTSLPPQRQYYAAGVPGSFYGCLFPRNCLHVVYSSFSLQLLSGVPKDVQDKSSAAWNKGKITYATAKREVIEAYEAQFAKDMDCFLHARAQEVVLGGLMALIIPGCPDATVHAENVASKSMDLLGACLMDLVKQGTISEEKVDDFNMPVYFASPEEVKGSVERNGCFCIEKMVELPVDSKEGNPARAKELTSHWRAVSEGLLKEQFGNTILDDLFDSLTRKHEESSIFDSLKGCIMFLLLKRTASD